MGNLEAAERAIKDARGSCHNVMIAGLRAYHGDGEKKPRRMRWNHRFPAVYGCGSHGVTHDETRDCIATACIPVGAKPKYKLEAGCTIRSTYVQESEVIFIRGALTILADGRTANTHNCEVTRPATPEAGDYVYVPGWEVLGTVDAQRPDGWWYIWSGGFRRAPQPRSAFTIIVKARHARQAMEDGSVV